MLHRCREFFSDFLRIYRVLPVRLKHGAVFVLICIAVQALLEIAAILAISALAVSIAAPERLLAIPVVAKLFAMFPWLDALREDPRNLSLAAGVGGACVVAGKNAMFAFVTRATAKLGEAIGLFVGEAIFRNYLYSPYISHLSGDSGKMYQAMSWRNQLADMLIQLVSVYTYTSITAALLLTIVAAIPGVVLLVLLCVTASAVGTYKALKGGMDRAGKGSAEADRMENKVTMNAMNGIRETLIYRQQSVFFEKFRTATLSGLRDRTFLRMAPPIPSWTLETVGFLAVPVTLGVMYVAQDASMAHITAVLTMMMLVCWRVLPLLNRAVGTLMGVRAGRHAAMDCLELLEAVLTSPLPEPPDPDPDFTLRRGIDFVDVNFRYPKAEFDCLHSLNFSIPCGTKIGVIGPSGAGKSSIAAIVSGLVEPTAGAMLVDGHRLTTAAQAAYCRQVGYVPQNPYVLGGSIAENVAFSQWGKEWDEEKVRKVCRMAELDIVEKCGVDYALGAGGIGLSGGQVQRLSIARALYADPTLLILDEATSALDSGVETAIMNTIFKLPHNMTIVIIAHRLTTVERCDALLWIDEGRVRASGPPEEILPRYQAYLRAGIRQ